jgi:redox-sensing transcriptional repressor
MATREDLSEDCDRGDEVSRVVSGRLSLYLRELQRLVHNGHETTSSTQLGRMLGVTGALVGYRGFIQQGFHVAIAFDNDPDKAGSAIEGVPIFAMHQLASQLAEQRIKLAALAVPMTAAQ